MLLIFDFDGTLFDALSTVKKLVKALAPKYNLENTSSKAILKAFELNFFKGMIKNGLKESQLKSFMKDCEKWEKTNYKAKPFKGITNAVKQLAKSNNLVIVSSNFSSILAERLKKYKLDSYFDEVVGADTAMSKTDKFKMLMKVYGDNAVLITDTLGDINAANKAGLKTIAVTWGLHSRETLKKGSPMKIISDIKELTTLYG